MGTSAIVKMSWLNLQEQSEAHNEVDRISNLPGHIVDIILSGVSLKEAVRTSILSSKWRYRWVTIPSLAFDNNSISLSTQDQTLMTKEWVSIVDRVLLLHTGPIHTFVLCHDHLNACSDIDRWILYLSRGGSVKELFLIIRGMDRYKVPSSIYSCQKLENLTIFNSVLKGPPEFNGFKSLKTLVLSYIYMDPLGFEQMISSSPLLERLTLMHSEGITRLNIHAPNLLYLDVGGPYAFEDISLQNTFNLTDVRIYCNSTSVIHRNPDSGSLIKFFASLPRIQELELCNVFLMYFTFGTIPGKLPTTCPDPKYLHIDMNFNKSSENLAALCLLRITSPNLHELELRARTPTKNHIDIVENLESFPLNQLRFIKISGISSFRQELNLIKMLLENAPLLETMSVKPASVESGCDLVKELQLFRRSSPSAQIVYIDP